MIRHVKDEYWETSDGAQHPTHEEAHRHEIVLLIVKVLSSCNIQTRDGLMVVARTLMNCPDILIVRAGSPVEVREAKR